MIIVEYEYYFVFSFQLQQFFKEKTVSMSAVKKGVLYQS